MATWKFYGQHHLGQYSGTAARRIDVAADTLKCSLHTNTYVPNQDTDDFFNDATNEVTGTLYTAGGVTLTGKSTSYDAGTNEFRLVFADPAWGPGATIANVRVAVVYKDTGSAATSPLIGYIVLDGDQSVSNGTLTIDVDATAVLKITSA